MPETKAFLRVSTKNPGMLERLGLWASSSTEQLKKILLKAHLK